MAKNPVVRMVGNSATLNQLYIDGVGLVAISGAVIGDASGMMQINLAAAQSPGYVAAIGDWDADTGW
jgi:hypothetical protein